MKKIITILVVVIGTMIMSTPPAKANGIGDAASSTWNTGKDVVTGSAHVLGDAMHTVAEFIRKTTHKVVMTAKDHPVEVGIGLAMLVATIAMPPLLSVDGEILATAMTVETTDVVATEVVATGTVATQAEGETLALVESTTEASSPVASEERCYVALKTCGEKIPPEGRDPNRYLTPAEKEALKERACGPKWCTSELTGKKFPRTEAQIDHIVPHALGGNTSVANSQVISKAENLAKELNCLCKNRKRPPSRSILGGFFSRPIEKKLENSAVHNAEVGFLTELYPARL